MLLSVLRVGTQQFYATFPEQDFFPRHSLTFSKVPDISPTAAEIPDICRFSIHGGHPEVKGPSSDSRDFQQFTRHQHIHCLTVDDYASDTDYLLTLDVKGQRQLLSQKSTFHRQIRCQRRRVFADQRRDATVANGDRC